MPSESGYWNIHDLYDEAGARMRRWRHQEELHVAWPTRGGMRRHELSQLYQMSPPIEMPSKAKCVCLESGKLRETGVPFG